MDWDFDTYNFKELSTNKLYDILALRNEVFIVEQLSPYLDLDGVDKKSRHLCMSAKEILIGYLRIVPPGVKFDEPSIGRIVISKNSRGQGLGRVIIQRGIDEVHKHYGKIAIRIEAQNQLRNFYSSMGFAVVSEVYDWDGIPHVKMLRP